MRKPVFPNTVVLFAATATLAACAQAARAAARKAARALPGEPAHPEPAGCAPQPKGE